MSKVLNLSQAFFALLACIKILLNQMRYISKVFLMPLLIFSQYFFFLKVFLGNTAKRLVRVQDIYTRSNTKDVKT